MVTQIPFTGEPSCFYESIEGPDMMMHISRLSKRGIHKIYVIMSVFVISVRTSSQLPVHHCHLYSAVNCGIFTLSTVASSLPCPIENSGKESSIFVKPFLTQYVVFSINLQIAFFLLIKPTSKFSLQTVTIWYTSV